LKKEKEKQMKAKEKLLESGAAMLSTQELLRIIIGNEEAATDVVREFDYDYLLRGATTEELEHVPGVGENKAVQIQAAIELGRRCARVDLPNRVRVLNSTQIGEMLIREIGCEEQENLVGLFLNTKNEIIKMDRIFRGTLDQSVAHPREIFKSAVKHSAAKIIVAHNHPSGAVRPSRDDFKFSWRLKEAGELMGIRVVDHLIVGIDDYHSMAECGEVFANA
jgi:DNA repair protein RadC